MGACFFRPRRIRSRNFQDEPLPRDVSSLWHQQHNKLMGGYKRRGKAEWNDNDIGKDNCFGNDVKLHDVSCVFIYALRSAMNTFGKVESRHYVSYYIQGL